MITNRSQYCQHYFFLGSDGNADLYFTDPEAQSDPQTGSPPREQSAGSRKQTGENEFSNIMAELSEKKSKLFRSSASAAKKKNSIGVPPEQSMENIVVRPFHSLTFSFAFIIFF